MNKKFLLSALAVAALTSVSLTSCNKSTPEVEEQSAAPVAQTGELKIAYVEVDSLMTQYEFCKDYALVLEKKSQNIQATLSAKGQKLQQAAQNFQQQVQANALTREQAQQRQAALQQENASIEALQQKLGAEFQQETEKYNKALRDSLQSFLAKYNKDKKYSLILTKQGDNILYANKSLDITKEVIAGLNKAYKKPANLSKVSASDEKKK